MLRLENLQPVHSHSQKWQSGMGTQAHPQPRPLSPLPGPLQPSGPTCFGELVCHLLPHGPGEVEVVVVLIDALQEQRDVLEDDGVLAPLLPSEAQLLVQPQVLGLLQGRAPGGIVQELGVEHQEQDAPNPEAEVVVTPSLAELFDSLRRGDIAHVMVAADEDQWDLPVDGSQHSLEVLGLLLLAGHPWKSEGQS